MRKILLTDHILGRSLGEVFHILNGFNEGAPRESGTFFSLRGEGILRLELHEGQGNLSFGL